MKVDNISMGWMDFANKISEIAWSLAGSNVPVVFELPDGKEIRFHDIKVTLFKYPQAAGGGTSYGLRVHLLEDDEKHETENI